MVGGMEYLAGEPYPLEIPSSASSGVKVQTGKFDILEGGTASVQLIFDGPDSIKKMKMNKNGVKLVPVMRANVKTVEAAAEAEPPAP